MKLLTGTASGHKSPSYKLNGNMIIMMMIKMILYKFKQNAFSVQQVLLLTRPCLRFKFKNDNVNLMTMRN